MGGLIRLEQLIQEAVVNVPRALIAEAVDMVVYVEGRGTARRLQQVVRVAGLDDANYRVESAV